MMLQPADAPGRAAQEGPAPAAPPPTQTETAPAQKGPPSGAGGGLSSMGFMLFLPLVLFGIILLMNRGEKKRRSELENKLKKGDRVVTRSGITGKLIEVGERTCRVEIAPGVNVTMVKTAIEGLDTGDEKAKPKDAKSSTDTKSSKGDAPKDKGKGDKKK